MNIDRLRQVPFRPQQQLPFGRQQQQRRGASASRGGGRATEIPGATPPPAEGGWGYIPEWGWGNFAPRTAPPDGGGGEQPPDTEQPPDGGGGGPDPTPEPGAVFEDTFRAGSLDQQKWFTRYIYNGPDGPGTLDYLNDEWERYRETGNHVLSNNGLALTSLPHNGDFWPSGAIRSKSLFDLASGEEFYFECRGKMPRGKGIWTAFWLSADARSPNNVDTVRWPPEIDVMEIVNNAAEDTTSMLGARCQVRDWNSNPQKYEFTETCEGYNGQFSVWYAPFDFADDYHLFGLHYKRPNFTIYCDRSLIVSGVYDWVWDDGSPAPPAHILTNLAIGGGWAGRYGIDESAFPQSFDVDYIRVYSSVTGNLPQAQIGKDYRVTG
jgi:beta-glucanase (GH16 family)